ncbi:M48 family metallopeptidase [Stenotrophomonas maltophilia]|uniref:M48 family metallopeptidase n=1 Tax=Stenotrophomonas maltophilia TaxID=40324 RepID=UPI002893C64A|nr:SprT family zinc-dependent metalloprotease [Stenotrophomonas maltophilia]MDT3486259.1 SprT family zinc-dependent metalloprotease [Stenotrophomonas maltophilia]
MQATERASQHRIAYGDEVIVFSLRRQPSRAETRVAIHVEPDARVLVDAPDTAPLAEVLVAVKKRARWISQHVSAAKARLAHVLPREYVSGESLHYLGRRYRLKVVVDAGSKTQARMRGAFISVTTPEQAPATIKRMLDAWYRQRAREVFSDRLAVVSAPLRWVKQLPSTRLQFMTVQWGSCSPLGRITLNPLLVKAPRECIDYVLLHELCHLLHHNHSPNFYRTLDRHMPNWREVKEKLDNMAEEIFRI